MEPTQHIRGWQRQLEQLREHLTLLDERANATDSHPKLVAEALETLHTNFEELYALLETVTQQHHALEEARAQIEAERQRYRDLFMFAPDGYLVTNVHGKIREANQAASALLNVASDLLVEGWLLMFVLPEDQFRFITMLQRLRAGEPAQEWGIHMQRHNSDTFSAAIVAQPVCGAQGNDVIGIRWLLRDVSKQVAQQEALQASEAALEQRVAERTADLRASEERLRFITENLDDVFWLSTPDSSKILYISPSYEQLFGRSCQSLYDDARSYLDAIHPDDQARMQQQIARPPEEERELTFRMVRPDGSKRWLWAHVKPIFDAAGAVIHRVGIVKDITAHKAHEAQIEALAYTDPLTGLANRRRLFDVGAEIFDQAQTSGAELALLYLDLDKFKAINDTWGHQTGDEVLRIVAARLRAEVRPADTVARLGGDEFAVLLPHASTERAVSVARRIIDDIAQPYTLHGQQICIDCSVGIVTLASAPQSFSQFVTLADQAMYQAKQASEAIAIYSPNYTAAER